jgi:heterotetrameric sarcosine oxidase gamma subunit
VVEAVERYAAAILPRRDGMEGLAEAVRTAFGIALPALGRWEGADDLVLVRTAPHQVLALSERDGLFGKLDAALGAHAGVVDLSDARVGVRIAGPGARERLGRLVGLDLHPSVTQAGSAASTLAGHIGVLVLQVDDAPGYEVLCQRSLATSLFRALR